MDRAGTVAVTVVYTFCFGMCMYLAMRVTGTIWAAIVLHGLTDPTTILSTGGVDEAVNGSKQVHLVFFDRHGWYCLHGRACPAVNDVRRMERAHSVRAH